MIAVFAIISLFSISNAIIDLKNELKKTNNKLHDITYAIKNTHDEKQEK